MDAKAELIERCAQKHAKRIELTSDKAFDELQRAVANNPEDFIADKSEESFALVVDALNRYNRSLADDEFLDDESYFLARKHRLSLLKKRCDAAIHIDEKNVDARLLLMLASDAESDRQLKQLLELEAQLEAELGPLELSDQDAWNDVFVRPRLRLCAAITRSCLDSARYSLCVKRAQDLMNLSPSDALGARMSCSLAYARLEDEEGFEALDMRYGRRGNAWTYLGRVLLMFKLDRMAAARRALNGFDRLCMGGAYALLRPTYVDTYLPDRPYAEVGSFEEVHMAVHEADPVVVDTPDFADWAQTQQEFGESAQNFAERYGFDW